MLWKEILVFLSSEKIREGKERKKKTQSILFCFVIAKLKLNCLSGFPQRCRLWCLLSLPWPLLPWSLVFYVCWSSEEADPHLRKVKAACWLLHMVQSGHEMQFCINPNRDLLVDSVTFGLKSLLWVKLMLRGKTLVGKIGVIKIVQNQPLRM